MISMIDIFTKYSKSNIKNNKINASQLNTYKYIMKCY